MVKQIKHKKVAVIGAGWAGCAAGVELASQGCVVSLFEAAHVPGGRARRVEINGVSLDNGQHILLGAYSESLRLMRQVGIDPDKAMLGLPLQMCYPPGTGGMHFATIPLPAPLHLLAGLLSARGLDGADKIALVRFTTAARWMGWQLHHDCSVLELLERFEQTPRLFRLMWRPLCIAALNTVPERASAKIFLNVLRDSLGAKRRASDMLIPRVDLSTLFPDQAVSFIEKQGGTVHYGHTVRELTRIPSGWDVDGISFDAVVVATPAIHAAALLKESMDTSVLSSLEYEPISTCYLQYPKNLKLSRPFFALLDDASTNRWGQFVFDRGQLSAEQAGLLAVVMSVSSQVAGLDHAVLGERVAEQLALEFKEPGMAKPIWVRVISDRRATFICSPNLSRPDNETEMNNLVLAGDYTASDYPATLESAIRSGVKAAKLIIKEHK